MKATCVRSLLVLGLAAGFVGPWGSLLLQAADNPSDGGSAPLVTEVVGEKDAAEGPRFERDVVVPDLPSVTVDVEAVRRALKTPVTVEPVKLRRVALKSRAETAGQHVVIIDQCDMRRMGAQTASQVFSRMPLGR